MKELIDEHQAHLIMLAVVVLAPLVGLAWGARTKRVGSGLMIGLLVGIGNYALWTIYNAITARLGLDTVANLLVNLGLFVVIGVAAGVGAGLLAARKRSNEGVSGGDDGNLERHRAG